MMQLLSPKVKEIQEKYKAGHSPAYAAFSYTILAPGDHNLAPITA